MVEGILDRNSLQKGKKDVGHTFANKRSLKVYSSSVLDWDFNGKHLYTCYR